MKPFKMIFPLLLLALLLLLLWGSQWAAEGVRSGLSLCYRGVLPALFPTMVVCGILAETTELLPLPPALSIWGVAQVGGYPAGIRTLCSAYERGLLSRSQALRLSACCSNASPAFLILLVGKGILGSAADGLLLYFCQTALSFLLAWGSGALRPASYYPAPPRPLLTVAANALAETALSALLLCGNITFFTALAALPPLAPLHGFLEITGGVRGGFYTAALMVGFSGGAVLLQNTVTLLKANLSPLPHWIGKLIYAFSLPFLGFLFKHLTNC